MIRSCPRAEPEGVCLMKAAVITRLEAGHLRATIDRKYALAAIVDAYRYVETGRKVGIVVIDVAAGGEGGHS